MPEPLTQRPVLHLPRSPLEVAVQVVAAAGVAAIAGGLLLHWADVPARVPSHFGVSGQADAWSGKGTLLAVPVVALALYILLSVVERLPHRYNYPYRLTEASVGQQYRLARALLTVMKAEIVWSFAYLTWGIVRTAEGETSGLGWVFLPALLALVFGTLGVYLCLARRAR